MILCAQQTFDKVYLDRERHSEFIEFIMYGVERELVNKLMDELKDHKIHIIELKEPEFIEDFLGPENPPLHRILYVRNLFSAETVGWYIRGARGSETNLMEMDSVHMERRLKMIEYIANGMPTWAYVLIGIATYEIAKKIIG